jgi:hypothetical protein
MQRHVAVSLLALIAGSATAQSPARTDPTDAAKRSPAAVYDSAFTGYRPHIDPELAPWREVNDEMARLGGHVGHVPGSAPPRAASPAKPPASGVRQ